MSVQDLALQRSKYKHLSDDEWRWFLQQVEGRERTADKLPTFAAIDDWWYPVRLSCEQCSSELAARYKASLCSVSPQDGLSSVRHSRSLLDLTGGYGVDTFFLSEDFHHTDYVEQNAELCRIAEHNFSLIENRKSIIVNNTTAEEFLQTASHYDLIFLDPARRDSHGGKVFRLEDCTPNVVELLPTLLAHLTEKGHLLLKLSPMLDITQALKTLAVSHSPLAFDVHVVAIKNEVKEVLLLSGGKGVITAIDLSEPEKAFSFTRDEESLSTLNFQTSLNFKLSTFNYLYEPSASILKAGAYKLVAQRFGLTKADVNTHLYFSERLIDDFPGRVWQIQKCEDEKMGKYIHANVLVRNYPLTAEQLKKKLKLKDGGDLYIIGCRINGKPTVLSAERI